MNIFAAIDLETTSLDPARGEVLELAIVPLNEDFTVSTVIPEFTARIRAKHPERIEQTALDVNKLDPAVGKPLEKVRAELALWTEENGITGIVPLAHNLAFDLDFLKASFPAFSRIVSGHGRDSMRLAITFNDLARMQDGEERFPSVSLRSLKLALDIEGEVQHHALEDAKDAAHVYRKLASMLRVA
ncbi:MAG: 3'-5' exonuclease [Lentisphaeria bacterium]|nr:3'-5' exonuclease [Lentisphaeria bacterium]